MYIERTYIHYVGTEQHTARAKFLIVFDAAEKLSETYLVGCVRKVALAQLGHWMMGTARIGNQSVTVSGDLGNDGLPCDFIGKTQEYKEAILRHCTPMPVELVQMWMKDTGHNSIGSSELRKKLTEWAKTLVEE